MYCGKCGNEIKDNEKFCSHCGAKNPLLKNNVEEVVETKTPDSKEESPDSKEASQDVVEKNEMKDTLPGQTEKENNKSEKKPNKARNIVLGVIAVCVIGYIFSSCGNGKKLSSEKMEVITALKENTDFSTEYIEQWKETFYHFNYNDEWRLQYTKENCSVRINEPLIQDWFTGCFGDIETGNDGTFAYIPAENWVNMYFDAETSEGRVTIVMYDINKDEYTVMADGDKYSVTDEFNSYVKEYGLSRILRADIYDFKNDLSTMGLTIKDLSQINDADLAKYMKEK